MACWRSLGGGGAVTQSSEPFYRAFISYSHADKACAGWLHRALESYRVPSKLVGRHTAVGEVPRRLTPIFKDREELPASSDLSRELEAALLASQFLIVIASPAAAASHWVNEEIRAFKQHRGEDNILVLIAPDDPADPAAADDVTADRFPEALRFRVDAEGRLTDIPAEPIAADLRPHGDGERIAKLKIVAGLTGLKLDDIVQREAQRRTRRLTALATAACLLALLMTTLTVVALKARTEAERQRAEADGLVEYMLTDLRSKLEPVGRLEVMDSVGARALKYYSGQDPGDLDADALGRRARALLLVGEVANLRGNLDTALATYRQAAATTSEQLRRDPLNGQRIFDHAQSVFWVGYIAWQRGDIPTARKYFGQYRDYAKQLAALQNGKPVWAAELGHANINLGVLEMDEGRLEQALDYFENAETVWAGRVAKASDKREDTYQLAQALAWQADVRRKMLVPTAALADRMREVKLYRDLLVTDPEDSKAKEGLSTAWFRIAQLHLEAGAPAKAVQFADASQAAIQALRKADPSNSLWEEMAVKSANVRTEALMISSDWAGARKSNLLALDQARQLVAKDAGVTEWRSDCLMPARWMEIAIAGAARDHALARQKIAEFERDFPVGDGPKTDEERFAWIMAYALEGSNWRSLGETARSKASFAQAAALVPATGVTDLRLAAAGDYLRRSSGRLVLSSGQGATRYNLGLLFTAARR
jgi:tetratricopeptide (TPR) repeat protein